MNDYAYHTRKLKQHATILDDCLLHGKYAEIGTTLKAMRLHLDGIEEWVEQQKRISEKSQTLAVQSAG